jgi:hypothetical protein
VGKAVGTHLSVFICIVVLVVFMTGSVNLLLRNGISGISLGARCLVLYGVTWTFELLGLLRQRGYLLF